MTIAQVLLTVADDPTGAHDLAVAIARADPSSLLAAALAEHLGGDRVAGVYAEADAFAAFIDGGGNRQPYDRVITLLREIHGSIRPVAVLDIGCGDGRVTAATLAPTTSRVDLVEPSAALLALAAERFETTGIDVVAHGSGAVEAVAAIGLRTTWGVAQATFALHTLTPADRGVLLRALSTRVRRLVIVEFDVPHFDDRSPEHATYAADRYERGVREYASQPDVVHGFLLPVLLGQFDPGQPRLTVEHPIDDWVRQLDAAGWQTVARRPVDDYWWAPAVCIEAVPAWLR